MPPKNPKTNGFAGIAIANLIATATVHNPAPAQNQRNGNDVFSRQQTTAVIPTSIMPAAESRVQ